MYDADLKAEYWKGFATGGLTGFVTAVIVFAVIGLLYPA